MKSITLQDGEKIFVDDEDYEKLNNHTWYKGYSQNTRSILTNVHINGRRKTIVIYELIKPGATQVIKNNDYRKSNLIKEDINRYSAPRFNQKSKYKGVSRDSQANKWKVSMVIEGRLKNLGRYVDEDKAAEVYNRAVDKYRKGKGFKNLIGEENRNNERDYKTRENQLNTRVKPSKKYRGITRRNGKFEVGKKIDGRYIYIGTYNSPDKAALVFNKTVLYLYGDEAILNDVPMTPELKKFICEWKIPKNVSVLKEE